MLPANNERFIAHADESAADEIVLDLEDSIAPDAKADARAAAAEALLSYEFRDKTRAVRVNAIDTEWHEDDVAAILGTAAARVDCIVVPKVESGDEVRALDAHLEILQRQLALTSAVALELQIESARGLDRVSEIAAACRRTETLVFGPGDLAASLGIPELTIGKPRTAEARDALAYFLARMVVAARAHGLEPIDGPFADIRDADALAASARHAAAIGCAGKWVIHPSQIGPINEAFTPAQADVDRAARILGAYAHARGAGVIRVGDEMVDEATRKMAETVIERGRRFGVTPAGAAADAAR